MGAPRKITIEYLNSLLVDALYGVVDRCDNPNYCRILFKSCGHTKDVVIGSIGNKLSYCDICFEDKSDCFELFETYGVNYKGEKY